MSLIPTHSLRFNSGVLEQMFRTSHSGEDVWKPVPDVTRDMVATALNQQLRNVLEQLLVSAPDDQGTDWLKAYYAETQYRVRAAITAIS